MSYQDGYGLFQPGVSNGGIKPNLLILAVSLDPSWNTAYHWQIDACRVVRLGTGKICHCICDIAWQTRISKCDTGVTFRFDVIQ